MNTLTVSNQKGGVAKTTTAIGLSAALAERERKVLLVDMDPQANLTMGVGLDPEECERTTFELLAGRAPIQKVTKKTAIKNLDLLPADLTLAGAEKQLYGELGFDELLTQQLDEVKEHYDYTVIDCPPSLGLLTLNSITAADVVIVPVQCEYFSAKGLTQLLEIVELVKKRRNPLIRVRVLATMYDRRNKICKEVLRELRKSFVDEMFEVVVGVDTKIRESNAAGQPITQYASRTRGSLHYRALAREVMVENEG